MFTTFIFAFFILFFPLFPLFSWINGILGDPLEQDTFLGPMIAENEAKRVEKWVKDATTAGAKVLVGGKREGSFFGNTKSSPLLPLLVLFRSVLVSY